AAIEYLGFHTNKYNNIPQQQAGSSSNKCNNQQSFFSWLIFF
ncbi:MAG: hypothetical protein ACI9NN_000168, partial [Bacteroidia bacterium]